MKSTIIFVLCLFSFAYSKPNILVVGAESNENSIIEVANVLRGTNRFNVVDYYNGESQPPPSLESILKYSAILIWNAIFFSDTVAYGNLMAAFLESGRGVVTGCFLNAGSFNTINGDWSKYKVFNGDDYGFLSSTNYEITDPTHPITDGMTTNTFKFGANPYYARVTSEQLVEGSKIALSFTSGEVFVAYRENCGPMNASRVDVGKSIY